MNIVYLAKQKIFNRTGQVYAHELLFRDNKSGIKEFPTNLQATAHVLLNTITNVCTNELLGGENGIAFINLDEHAITSGIVDSLDKKRFVLEILETTNLTEKVIARIKQYHTRGFQIAIDDFDCSSEMLRKFAPIFKYINIIKVDIIAADEENLKKVVTKIKQLNIQILAEKIENDEEYKFYRNMGFDLFQGYHLHKPEIIEIDRHKDATKATILSVIKLIRDDGHTAEIESFIKQRVALSYKLIKFINNELKVETRIESIAHVITLLGRDKLLRWLLIYLYSEPSNNLTTKNLMAFAIQRAEKMEEDARKEDKDKAYIAGMFSMLGTLFDTDIKQIMKGVKVDKDIMDLVVDKKGKFFPSFSKIVHSENEHLKHLLFQNFEKVDVTLVIAALESIDVFPAKMVKA
ncbi:MAG: EAL domain-containing protein [Sulfurimonas sp.]|jgi:EAL and modified HD-GYP domain-containing signal transduction protein